MSILSCFLSERIRKPSDTAISDLEHLTYSYGFSVRILGPDSADLTIRQASY